MINSTNPQLVFGNKADKICQKFLKPKGQNLTGWQAYTVLERLGYQVNETGSSHHKWVNKAGNVVNLALHNPKQQLKPYQIEEVANAINLDA